MNRPPPAPALTDDEFAHYCALVQKVSGIALPPVRRSELEQAVHKAQLKAGLANARALYDHLTQVRGRPALTGLIEALTIGETHFFRNQPQFHALTHQVLPEIIARRRATRRLRVWSAGCSTGEEAYSLAILIDRLLPDAEQWQIHLLGTDLNRQSLDKARRGVYSAWSFREVPPDIQASYFVQRPRGQETDYEVVGRLRSRVQWDVLNLNDTVYPAVETNTHEMDLILFRNVLIYFSEATARQVVGRLYACLTDKGWLVVGHADTSLAVFHEFKVHNFPGTVLYQKPAAAEAAQRHALAHAASPTSGRTRPLRVVAPVRVPRRVTDPLKPRAAAPPAPAARVPDAQALYAAAKQHADQHALDAALTALDAALDQNPMLGAAHYLHGLILQERGQPAAALEALRRCVYAEPRFVLGHYALGSLLASQGQAERARKSLDNVVQLLAGRPRDELVPEGDSLTVGRLLELAALRQGM